MNSILATHYGPQSRDQRESTSDSGHDGALASLETFYYALNHRDLEALSSVWLPEIGAQLNNPLGGILRGGDKIVQLYGAIFSSGTSVEVTFQDIAEYATGTFAVFAGREIGTYSTRDGLTHPLRIRTTRVFEFTPTHNKWLQVHHHGSIDDPAALKAYQEAVGSKSTSERAGNSDT